MKKFLCLALLGTVFATNAYCSHRKHVTYYCSEDHKSLMAMDEDNNNTTIQDGMVIWDRGLPKPGCTDKILEEISQKGFYCDGHYLSDDKNQEEEFADVPSCERALEAKPDRW